MSMKITLALDKNLYKKLEKIRKNQNYLSVQEYVRDVLREHLQRPEIIKISRDIERRLKRLIS